MYKLRQALAHGAFLLASLIILFLCYTDCITLFYKTFNINSVMISKGGWIFQRVSSFFLKKINLVSFLLERKSAIVQRLLIRFFYFFVFLRM